MVALVAPYESVIVFVALPPEGSATSAGLKLHDAPAGRPVQDRLTLLVKAFRLPIVVVLVPLAPCTIVRLAGEVATEKSGVGGGVCRGEREIVGVGVQVE